MLNVASDPFLRHPLLPDGEVYELIENAQTGDQLARNRLVQHHYRLVWGLAVRYGQAHKVDVADLISKGLEIVDRSITAYDSGRRVPFPSYLTKNVARGLSALAFAEKKGRLPIYRDQVGDGGSWLENVTEEENADQERSLFQKRLVDLMPKFLGKLVNSGYLIEEHAEALRMKYGLDGRYYTNDEIDTHFGMSRGWARVTISRCLSDLSKKLEGMGLEDFLG